MAYNGDYPPVNKVRKRPVRPPRSATAIRLPDELHARLVTAAVERDVSTNFLVTKAVEQFMDRLIPVEEMRWTRD